MTMILAKIAVVIVATAVMLLVNASARNNFGGGL
jgi:hypothetical protein